MTHTIIHRRYGVFTDHPLTKEGNIEYAYAKGDIRPQYPVPAIREWYEFGTCLHPNPGPVLIHVITKRWGHGQVEL